MSAHHSNAPPPTRPDTCAPDCIAASLKTRDQISDQLLPAQADRLWGTNLGQARSASDELRSVSELQWCGRRDSNPYSQREADFRTTSAFAAAQRAFVVWTVPSPWPSGFRRRPSSLYTFTRVRAWLGIGLRHCLLAFPDFERFCTADFPAGTPIEVCCVYRFRHVRFSVLLMPQTGSARDG